MNINSPITNSGNTQRVDSINVAEIIDAYRKIGVGNGHLEKYLAGKEKIDICECLDTGYRFYYPLDIFGDNEFYAYLQKQRKYYADWRWEHEFAYKQIKNNQKVLEIGCGTGNFLKRISEEKNTACVGLEMNTQALNEAENKGLEVFNQTIQQHAMENNEKYDVVCFFQVLEHVYETGDFLKNSLKCLKRGGLFIVGVPNNNPYLFRHDRLHALNLPPHHAGLWDISSLRRLPRFFDMRMLRVATEPLSETDFFWDVNVKFWKDNNKVVHFLILMIPDSLKRFRNYILKRFCSGRNIIAIYKKNEK